MKGLVQFAPILNRSTNPERLIRTIPVQTRTGLTKPSKLTAWRFGHWILKRFAKPYAYLAQSVSEIGCKFGSGIGLPDQMVSLAQTIFKLGATVLLSIHGGFYPSARNKLLKTIRDIIAPGVHHSILPHIDPILFVSIVLKGCNDVKADENVNIFKAFQNFIIESGRFKWSNTSSSYKLCNLI